MICRFTELTASGHLAYDALCFVSLRFPLPIHPPCFAVGGGFFFSFFFFGGGEPEPALGDPEFGRKLRIRVQCLGFCTTYALRKIHFLFVRLLYPALRGDSDMPHLTSPVTTHTPPFRSTKISNTRRLAGLSESKHLTALSRDCDIPTVSGLTL